MQYCCFKLWVILFLLISLNVKGNNTYQIKKIEFNIPTSDNSVKQLAYDKNGNIWFFNSKGLYRFNGKQLIHVNTVSGDLSLLNSININCIKHADNLIYLGTNKGVFSINDNNEITPIGHINKRLNIIDFAFLANGSLVAISSNGIITMEHKMQGFKVNVLPKSEVYKLVIFNNAIHVAVQKERLKDKILKFDSELNLKKTYALSEGVYAKSIAVVHHSLIISANKKVLLYDSASDSFLLTSHRFNGLELINSFIDSNVIFVELPNKISIGDLKNKTHEYLSFKNSVIINDVCRTPNDEYLLGTNSGIYVLHQTKINYSVRNEQSNWFHNDLYVRRKVLEDENNLYYLYYGGIVKQNKKSGLNQVLHQGEIYAYTGLVDGDYIWLGTDGAHRLGKLNKHTGQIHWFETKGLANQYIEITSILDVGNHHLLLSCSNKGSPILFNKLTGFFSEIKLRYNNKPLGDVKIRMMTRLNVETILLASNIGLVSLDKNFNVKSIIHKFNPNHDTDYEEVHTIYVISDSIFWIGLDDGIAEIKLGEIDHISFVDLNQKLLGRKCIYINQDAKNVYWIATYNGLFSYDDVTKNVFSFSSAEGLPDDEYNFEANTKLTSGELILGGLNAYIKVVGLTKTKASLNNLNFSKVSLLTADGSDLVLNTYHNYINLNKGEDVLQLNFALNDFLNPALCSYYYKIENHTDWIPIGNNGFLQLWNLPDRRNNILIKGVNSLGVEGANQLVLHIHYKTPIYEQTWFLIFLTIVAGVLITLFILYRQYNYKRLRDIKDTLLYDIHDEIGSILTKTSMHAELMLLRKSTAETDLKFIAANIKEAIQSLRNVLWTLDNESNDINNLIDRARANLSFVFRDSHFDVHVENRLMNDRLEISIEMKRNILLIIKEAAVNTLKYSDGNLFNVLFSQSDRVLNINIKDNGDCSAIERGKGYGLDSIEKRVKNLKGQLSILTNKDGFEIIIELHV